MKKCIILLFFALVFTIAIFAESGDINVDGKEDLRDVLAEFKQILLDVPSKYADVDGDGEVTISDGMILINRIVNEPIANELANASNTFDFTATGAAWSYNNGQLVVNSVSNGGDGFAISNVYIPGGTSFEVEATMQITEGNCGGITFGVASPVSPSATGSRVSGSIISG